MNRKKRNIIIATLACLLIFMGVGYSVLSETIKISSKTNVKGKWNIKITNISVEKKGLAKYSEPNYSDLSAELGLELYAPGDSVTYTITVRNEGNIKASLSQITSSVDKKYEEAIFSTTGMGQGEVLSPNEEKQIVVKCEFDKSATSLPADNLTLNYKIELLFAQYTGSSVVDPSTPDITNTCFAVDNTGLITDYDFINCGLDINVPYSVNNTVVTKVNQNSFFNSSYIKYLVTNGYKKTLTGFLSDPDGASTREHYLFESEEDLNSFLAGYYPGETKADVAYNYDVVILNVGDLSDKSKIKVPANIESFIAINDNGEEVYPGATQLIYVYYDTNSGLVENENALSACNKYIEAGGSISTCYIIGSEEANTNLDKSHQMSIGNNLGIGYFKDGNEIIASHNRHIKSLDFSNATGLTEIGSYIVGGSLQKVVFNNTLQKIGNSAFGNNHNLGNVDIPASVTSIGTYAFNSMTSDKTIRIRRKNSTGLTLGASWNGKANIVYRP